MRAIVQDKYGAEPADVLRLEQIDRPQIGENDVLVRVHAASVHIGDWHVMTGLPYLLRVVGFGFRAPKVRVRGMDVAGTVETIGANVTNFRAGDEVYGTCNGSFAEYASTPQDTLAPKPGNLTFEQAATIPTSAVAALQALRDAGRLQAGQQGPARRSLGRCRNVRNTDRQSARRRGDRCLQHSESGPGPFPRR